MGRPGGLRYCREHSWGVTSASIVPQGATSIALTAGLTFRALPSPRHQGQEGLQILDVRQALESGLIGAAMDQMTPQQLAAVEESVRRLEALASAGEQFIEADAEFHSRHFDEVRRRIMQSGSGAWAPRV